MPMFTRNMRTPTRMSRLAATLLAFALIALLGACGGQRRFLGPPGLSVQEIELANGRYVARVRLDSPASMPLVLQSFDWKLSFDGAPAASGMLPLDLTLAPEAGDIVRIDLGAEQDLPTLASLNSAQGLAYVLEGELKISSPSVRYPLRYAGRLRPTPGKPGSFR